MKLNNMNIFQKRASERGLEKYSNVVPSETIENIDEIQVQEDVIEEPKQNIFQQYASKNEQKKEDKFGFIDTIRDIGQQVASKVASGAIGSYGNILDAFGLQVSEENQVLPGKKEVYDIQGEILDKINRGETPSFSELMMLSDDDVLGDFTRLPTSKEAQRGIKNITGIDEGKTTAGRIAGRGAEFVGEGLATGGGAKALASLAGAGLAGQGVRESGGPESLATAVEIGGSLAPSLVSKKLIPTGKGAKDIVEAGRKVGLSESQIAPLIQSEGKTAVISKVARKGTKTKKLFSSIKESLGDSYNTIKSSPQANVKIPNQQQINLRKEFGEIRNQLSKTLSPSPDKEAAIKYIEKSLETLRDVDVTPEYLINFWQDINKSVKWNSISGGKKALTALKDPISNTLKKVSPKLAEDFELTNKLYSKYAEISKKLKPGLVDSFVNKAEIVSGIPSGIALATGNPLPLMGLGGEVATRLLAREMLINPYFQNIGKKLVTNFNQSSTKGVTELVNQVKDYMKRKHPQENWEFLTSTQEIED